MSDMDSKRALRYALCIRDAFRESELEPRFCFAVARYVLYYMAFECGHSPESFRLEMDDLCELVEIGDV
jgi:hypothetical protein